MAEEKNRHVSSEDSEESRNKERASPQGTSRYSGMGKSESFDDWLERKRAKKEQPKSTGKGLRRRTGLGTTGLGNGTLKRTPLNKVSKKQKKRNKDYGKAKERHYAKEENRSCYLCGSREALSIHHKAKRGSNTADESTFVTLCLMGDFMDRKYPDSNHSHTGGCHAWIEANKSIAREIGLL